MRQRELTQSEIRQALMERASRELLRKYPNARTVFVRKMAKIAVKEWMKRIDGKDTVPLSWWDRVKAKLPLWAQRGLLRPRYKLVPKGVRP
jgi:hypothetical protein